MTTLQPHHFENSYIEINNLFRHNRGHKPALLHEDTFSILVIIVKNKSRYGNGNLLNEREWFSVI